MTAEGSSAGRQVDFSSLGRWRSAWAAAVPPGDLWPATSVGVDLDYPHIWRLHGAPLRGERAATHSGLMPILLR